MSFSIESVENKCNYDDTLIKRIPQYQNYIPIYDKFFTKNLNVTLNYTKKIDRVESTDQHNKFIGKTVDNEKITMFAKFCPLMDTTKVLVGKENLQGKILPTQKSDIFSDENNSAYVDSFFSFLTSKMLHQHGFFHGLDCYGSLLAIQEDFRVDIQEDIEYLFESEFFLENRLNFNIKDEIYEQFEPVQSCKYKKKLLINDDDIDIEVDKIDLQVEPIIDCSFDFKDCYNQNSDLVYIKQGNNNEKSKHSTNESSSSCSSRSSVTTGDEESISESVDEDDYSSGSSLSDLQDRPIYATIKNYPVNMVFLESCEETLDEYMLNNDINEEEWSSILMQIIMSLIVLQEKFYFIHNDLHTSNVMYIPTDKQFLCYKYGDTHYKVPTFGKIWKIIDFGRAIYKFKGSVMFSDSFSEKGDASTQYNCEPFLNPTKKIVPPNFSFDLCRLACSLFDFFDEIEGLDTIKDLIDEWVKDDKGRNILYKNNGDERYPDFKLYKMITRSVHHLIPKDQLGNPLFSQYSVSRKNIRKNQFILKIDDIPSYVS